MGYHTMLSQNELTSKMVLASACIAGELICTERDRDNCIDNALSLCSKVSSVNVNDHTVLFISARCQQIFSNRLNMYLSVIEPVFQAFSIRDNFVTFDHAHLDTERAIDNARDATMQISQTHQPIAKSQIDTVARRFLAELKSTSAGKKILSSYAHILINQDMSADLAAQFGVKENILRDSTHLKCSIDYFNGSLFSPLMFVQYLSNKLSAVGDRENVLIKTRYPDYCFANENALYEISVSAKNKKPDLVANVILKVVSSSAFKNHRLCVNAQDDALMMAFEQSILTQIPQVDSVWLEDL